MIKNVDFQRTTEEAFLKYAASVAQERAIPDVRDMLKIGLRQGLYAQYTNKLTHKDKFQKAQKSVAAAMAQSYTHGDVAMYDTLIRVARPWTAHYPLEDVQGSYGNPSSPDSHAAARYVEMKASELSDYLFIGLKKNAIDEWYDNYDDTEQIPSVFPSIGYWNIVNGCSGIAVAMATSVPQFNLKEVNDALIKLIKDPNISDSAIYCAPDFATGGTITNANAVKTSLLAGHGNSVRLRATLKYDPDQNMIQATELPYGVFTNTVMEQLGELTDTNSDYGIDKVIDHTKKTADIRIYLNKGVNPNKMIAKLYKDTSLENWFSVNMVLLDKGRYPKIFTWREACNAYITHIQECERNILKYDLDKALARENIVEGLLLAAANIDDVVAIIRNSSDPDEATTKLMAKYGFNEPQVKAILAMKLASLTKIDSIKLNNELEELRRKIEELQYILSEPAALNQKLIEILEEVSKKFGDTRRTKITNILDTEEEEAPASVEEKEVSVMLFDNNMFRIINRDELQGAKRGRKGTNVKPPKNATLINTLNATNMGSIAAITNYGKMYTFSLHSLDVNKDYSIYEVINLEANEKVILLLDVSAFNAYKYLLTVSKNGFIKKSSISEYTVRSKKGTAAVKLEAGDKLIGVYLAMSDADMIMVANNTGYYNMYSIDKLSTTGKATKGVKAIKLEKDETIISATLIRNGIEYRGILTISTSGKGKITVLDDYTETSRAVRGSAVMSLKDEQLAVIYALPESKGQVYITANNKAVLLDLNAIPVQGRNTAGVSIINTRGQIEIM